MEFLEKIWDNLKSAFSGAGETISNLFSGFGGHSAGSSFHASPQQIAAGLEYAQPQQRMAYDGLTPRQQQYPNGPPQITSYFNNSVGQGYVPGVTPSVAFQQGGLGAGLGAIAGSLATSVIGGGLQALNHGVIRWGERTRRDAIHNVLGR